MNFKAIFGIGCDDVSCPLGGGSRQIGGCTCFEELDSPQKLAIGLRIIREACQDRAVLRALIFLVVKYVPGRSLYKLGEDL